LGPAADAFWTALVGTRRTAAPGNEVTGKRA
jgi:hypothetical protein